MLKKSIGPLHNVGRLASNWLRVLVILGMLACSSSSLYGQFNSTVQFWSLPSPNNSVRVVSVFRDGNLAITGGYPAQDQLFVLNRFQGTSTYQFPEPDARVSIWAPPSAPDIVIGGFNGRQGLFENGAPSWNYPDVGCCNLPHDPFAIDPSAQRAYFSANFVAYNLDANLGKFSNWVYFPNGSDFTGYLSLSDSTHLYQAGSNVNGTGGHVSLLNPSGAGIWNVQIEPGIGGGPYNELQPGAVAADGSIVVTSAGVHFGVNPITPGRLARIQQDGTLVFSQLIDAVTPPVIGGNNFIFVGTQPAPVSASNTGQVQAYGLDGSLRWSTSVNGQPNDLLVGDDGLVYVGVGDLGQGQIIGLDQNDGDMKFTANVPGAWEIILYGGVIYASGYSVTAVPVSASGYDPRSPWPVRMHDNQRTGSATAPFYNTVATTTNLSSSASLQVSGGTATLTAMVSATGGTVPTGSVVFTDNGTTIATSALDSTGHATFTPSPLPVGWHVMRAYYTGDANYSASISSALKQGIAADDDSSSGGTLTGNQTVKGNLTATSFTGNGSGLTGVNAVTSNYSTSSGTAANAINLGGVPAFNYARVDVGNVFSGNQSFLGTVNAGSGVFGQGVCSGGSCSPGVKGQGYFGLYGQGDVYGVFATSNGGPGVHAESATDAGLFGSGIFGVVGTTNIPTGIAGAFNGYNGSKILSGQSSGAEVFSVDTNGKLTSSALALPPLGTASGTTTGFNSGALDQTASVFNGSAAVQETFRWQIEPLNQGGPSASAAMNLLFGSTSIPAETGLSIRTDGTINFAVGQTFPGTGTGTISGVTAGAGLSGGGTSGNVSLNIPPGGVTNGMLANPSVTVNAGTGLAGGGFVPLGGNTTLSVAPGGITDAMLANPSLTVAAGAGLAGGGSVPLGGTATVSLAPQTCAAGSAVTAHPFTCTGFPTFGANVFTGTQTVTSAQGSTYIGTGTVILSNLTNNTGISSFSYGNAIQGISNGTGPYAYGVWGQSTNLAGVYGNSTSGSGVQGYGNPGSGVYGISTNSGNNSTIAAGVFNNVGPTNVGSILLGQYNGTNEFVVDAKGDVTANGNISASGSVTIGAGGTPITEYVSTIYSATLPVLTAGSCLTFTTATLTGFTPGSSDSIALGLPKSLVSSLGGSIFLIYQAWETTTTASPTITIQVCNPTGSRYAGGAMGTIRVDVFKH